MSARQFVIYGFLSVLLQVGGASLLAQHKLSFVPRLDIDGSLDTIYHDKVTQTIDFFIEASIGDQQYWDFYEKNLFIEESVGENTLQIVSQLKIKDEAHFGGRSVYQIKTRSSQNYHRDQRTYTIYWKDAKAPDRTLASISASKSWPPPEDFSLVGTFSFWDLLVLCLLLLAVSLFALSELAPWWVIRSFKKQYVFPYSQVKKAGERKLNPVTGHPLIPSDLVVHKCQREICDIPLRIWERRNYRCYHCPTDCDGSLNIWTRKFFTQKGGAKKLNWLWFGAAGGALAWIIYGLIQYFAINTLPSWTEEVLWGSSLGLGFAFMLSWVEELGQSREFSFLRLLLRTLMGATLGAVVFFGFSQLGNNILISISTWLFFCTLLGLVLSINSSIPWKRGLFSGFVAGIASALVYFLIPKLVANPEAEFVKMIALLVAGTLLGYFIIKIVKQLDKIELQVVSPSYRSGMVYSLDNFLKAGTNIIIGKAMKHCTVRVKWDDEYVLGQHAEMKMNDNQVTIRPLDDAEIWVGENRLVNKQTQQLKGGEMIKLGRNSKTIFKYIQRE